MTVVESTGGYKREIKARIEAAQGKVNMLGRILKKPYIRNRTKAQLVESIVIPTLTYGAETWSTTTKDDSDLEVLLNRCRRKCLGTTRRDRQEISELHRKVNLPSIRYIVNVKLIGHFII